jgi:cyclase
MQPMIETIEDFSHFQLKKVAVGVYAAITVQGTGSLGNAAIIDLGDETLVVDTFMNLEAALDLRKAAEHLFGRPVSYVFNTHWHADHTFGNQIFTPAAHIISTSKTREIMATLVAERNRQHLAEPEAIFQAIDEFEQLMKQEKDEKLKQEMAWDIQCEREYMRTLPELRLTLPTLTFDQQMSIHGSKRTVHLITYGGGHTQSDAFLYIPEEKIAILGDLVLSNHHPVMKFANPWEWQQILERIEALNLETIIPGHGDICSLKELRQVRGYITDLLELVQEIVQNQGNINDIPVPEAYRSWYFTLDFKGNLQAIHDLLSKKHK